jgi:hypothetical protein
MIINHTPEEEAEMEKAALKVHYELDEKESARIEEDECSE